MCKKPVRESERACVYTHTRITDGCLLSAVLLLNLVLVHTKFSMYYSCKFSAAVSCLYHLQLHPDIHSMHRADSWIRSTIPYTKIKLCDFVIYIWAFFCMYAQPCNRRWSQLIFITGNKSAHTSSTKVWRIRKYWKEKGIDLWDKCIFESHFSSEYPDT